MDNLPDTNIPAEPESQPITKPRKAKRLTSADKHKITRLALEKNLSCHDIAKITGHGKTRISEIVAEVKSNPDIELFADNKDKVFEGLQAKLINLADDDLLKTMLSKRGMTDVAILQDKINLLRGQATEIHDVQIRHLIASIVVDNPVDNPIIDQD